MKTILTCLWLLASGPALAQAALPPPFPTPSWVPDEETKRLALLIAYELNGNSMVGKMIDLSKQSAPVEARPAEKRK